MFSIWDAIRVLVFVGLLPPLEAQASRGRFKRGLLNAVPNTRSGLDDAKLKGTLFQVVVLKTLSHRVAKGNERINVVTD